MIFLTHTRWWNLLGKTPIDCARSADGIGEGDTAVGIKAVSTLTVDVLEFGGGAIGSEV
jgi:hypothetical protein